EEAVLDPGDALRVLHQLDRLVAAAGEGDGHDLPARVVRRVHVGDELAALDLDGPHRLVRGGLHAPLLLAVGQVDGDDLVGPGPGLSGQVQRVAVGGDALAALEVAGEDGPAALGGEVLVEADLGAELAGRREGGDVPRLLVVVGAVDDHRVDGVGAGDAPALVELLGPLHLAGLRVQLAQLVVGVVAARAARGDLEQLLAAREGRREAGVAVLLGVEQLLAAGHVVGRARLGAAHHQGAARQGHLDGRHRVEQGAVGDLFGPALLARVQVDLLHLVALGAAAAAVHGGDDDLVVGRRLLGDRADLLGEGQRLPGGAAVGDVVREQLLVGGLDRGVPGDPHAGGLGAGTGGVGRLLVPELLGLARRAALVEVLGVGVAVAAAVPGVDRVVGGARLGVVGSPGDGLLVLLAVVVTADERPGGASGDEQRRHGGTDDHGRLPLERVAGTAAGRGSGRAGELRLRVAVSGLPVGAGLLWLAVRTGLVRPGGVGAGLLSGLLRVAVPGLRRTGRRALRRRRDR